VGSKAQIGAGSHLRATEASPDSVLCFSHLRWNFVFQRPQHLMSRFARDHRVFFIEEPVMKSEDSAPYPDISRCPRTGVVVATPHLPLHGSRFAHEKMLKEMLDGLRSREKIVAPIAWYYTPAMYAFSRHVDAAATVYDCMDELANFRLASPQLPLLERELMHHADIVSTGGHSLYEAKRAFHGNVHAFPSSVDRAHFETARYGVDPEPDDQVKLGHPRLGYFGVLDERIDWPLLASIADARPEWSIVMVGPVAKIAMDELPERPNLHYLGRKAYEELPRYLAGWDVALMPFAINEATRFISPTKTPEYLAGGKPVVSTPVTDVLRQYGNLKCVRIARSVDGFIDACEDAMAPAASSGEWLREADHAIEHLSWDSTFRRMLAVVGETLRHHAAPTYLSEDDIVLTQAGAQNGLSTPSFRSS